MAERETKKGNAQGSYWHVSMGSASISPFDPSVGTEESVMGVPVSDDVSVSGSPASRLRRAAVSVLLLTPICSKNRSSAFSNVPHLVPHCCSISGQLVLKQPIYLLKSVTGDEVGHSRIATSKEVNITFATVNADVIETARDDFLDRVVHAPTQACIGLFVRPAMPNLGGLAIDRSMWTLTCTW